MSKNNNKLMVLINFVQKITLYKLAEHYTFTYSVLNFRYMKREFSIIKIVYSLLFSKISL